jgi:hypothetical protein
LHTQSFHYSNRRHYVANMEPQWDSNLDTFSVRAVFSQCACASEHHKLQSQGSSHRAGRQCAYNVTMARSCNHCCNGNPTIRSVWRCVTYHCQLYKDTECCIKMFYTEFMSPATIESTYAFMQNARHCWPTLTKFGVPRQIFVKSAQYQICPVAAVLTHANKRIWRS